MADNVVLNAGSGGSTIASDDIAGVHYARTKIVIGADGSNDGDVASGNPLPILVAAGATNIAKAEDAAHSSGDTGVTVLAVRRDTAAVGSGTDGDYSTLNVDATGKLWTNDGYAQSIETNTSDAVTSLQLIDDAIFTDDAAFTPGTSKVAAIGLQADEASTDSVDEGDIGCPRMTLDRKIIVTPLPHTAGGCSIFRSIDIDETEEDVKTAAGQVYGIYAINTTNATLFLKLYNATAANVTVGTTTPVLTLPVPGNNDTDGSGFYLSFPVGVEFTTAISVACTTGVADADTGAPGANACIVQVFYK